MEFFDVFGGWEGFGFDTTLDEHFANGAIIFNMLIGDGIFAVQIFFDDVVTGEFGGEVFGFDGEGGEEIGEGSALGNGEFLFHFLGGVAAEEGLITFGADDGEAFVVDAAFVDNAGEFLFGLGEFVARGDAIDIEEALFDDFLFAGLDGEVGLGKGDFAFGGVAILGNEVASVAGEGNVVNFPDGTTAKRDHFPDIGKWSVIETPAFWQATFAFSMAFLKLSHLA